MWKPGASAHVIGLLATDHKLSSASGINAKGQVVGASGPDEEHAEAFIWSEAEGMRGPGFLADAAPRSHGTAINASGQVAGSSSTHRPSLTHAVLWDQAGAITDLGALSDRPNRFRSGAYALDDAGRVVGVSMTN